MGDRQFSIPKPAAMMVPGEEPSLIYIDCFGGGEYFITVRDQIIKFEWSERFGPAPLNKNGSIKESIGPKHPFWRAASLWNLQGRRMEGKNAIWHEPKKDVLERRGNQLFVIEQGEPGQDW